MKGNSLPVRHDSILSLAVCKLAERWRFLLWEVLSRIEWACGNYSCHGNSVAKYVEGGSPSVSCSELLGYKQGELLVPRAPLQPPTSGLTSAYSGLQTGLTRNRIIPGDCDIMEPLSLGVVNV